MRSYGGLVSARAMTKDLSKESRKEVGGEWRSGAIALCFCFFSKVGWVVRLLGSCRISFLLRYVKLTCSPSFEIFK